MKLPLTVLAFYAPMCTLTGYLFHAGHSWPGWACLGVIAFMRFETGSPGPRR